MKYKYYNVNGILFAESDSVIKFNMDLLPVMKDVKPVISKTKKQTYYKNEEEKNEL